MHKACTNILRNNSQLQILQLACCSHYSESSLFCTHVYLTTNSFTAKEYLSLLLLYKQFISSEKQNTHICFYVYGYVYLNFLLDLQIVYYEYT